MSEYLFLHSVEVAGRSIARGPQIASLANSRSIKC